MVRSIFRSITKATWLKTSHTPLTMLVRVRKQDELPELLPFAIALVAEDDGLAGQNSRDDVGRRRELTRAHLHQVAFLQVLLPGADDLILGYLAANQPFQPGVGVHAGLIYTDLQQTGVDLLRCGFDRDRAVDHPGRLGQAVIPGGAVFRARLGWFPNGPSRG